MGFFDLVPLAPPDPILGLTSAFLSDKRALKVNLGVGLYKETNLQTPVLVSVKMAEKILLQEEKSKEYLPISGDELFLEHTGELVFGKTLWSGAKGCISSFQSLGGTGALSIGATFLREVTPGLLYISNPTWQNHKGIFGDARFEVKNYPYYDSITHQLCYEAMLFFLNSLAEESVVVLHAACHNPTGADLNENQWKEIAEICMKKKLIPFFDSAYQGFGRSLEKDVFAIRYFLEKGLEIVVATSYSKNFSFYGERMGALFIVSASDKVAKAVTSRVKQIIRTRYSNPPMHGAKIIRHILGDAELRGLWQGELEAMRGRIFQMRLQLAQELTKTIQTVDFRYLHERFGMFCFSNLKKAQVDRLIAEYGIYMTSDGRMNVCGLNPDNLDYVVRSIGAIL